MLTSLSLDIYFHYIGKGLPVFSFTISVVQGYVVFYLSGMFASIYRSFFSLSPIWLEEHLN